MRRYQCDSCLGTYTDGQGGIPHVCPPLSEPEAAALRRGVPLSALKGLPALGLSPQERALVDIPRADHRNENRMRDRTQGRTEV